MDRNYSFSLLVWDYLRSPAKNLSFYCRVSKIGHELMGVINQLVITVTRHPHLVCHLDNSY